MHQTPDGLEQRLLARARDAGLTAGDRLVVAFSGGRDSLALAAALRWAASVLGVQLQLIHVDHRLRSASASEAERAEALARALGLEARVIPVPAPVQGLHPGIGLEDAARRERYRLLCDAALAAGACAVATAHHLDDQAETVLLHLLRGGGVHGAGGMAERGPLPATACAASDISQKDRPWLWRPCLREPREVITTYVDRLDLEPIEDPSNADPAFRRNVLRHDILPVLEAQFPGAKAALARYAMLAAEEDQVLAEIAATAMEDVISADGSLMAAHLCEQPLALRRRILRRWLVQQTSLSELSADRTDAVLGLAQEAAGGVIEIGAGWTIRRERGKLRAAKPAIDGEG